MHRGIHLIKNHFAVILYVLGNACYIFNSSNDFFLQIHFTRIIDMHFLKTMFHHFHLGISLLFQGNILHKLWLGLTRLMESTTSKVRTDQ